MWGVKLMKRKNINYGFSIVELIIVAGILSLLSAVAVPISLNIFQKQQVARVSQDIENALKKAQNNAVYLKNDTDWGVKLASNTYVLFEGSSFSARDSARDESYDLSVGADFQTNYTGDEIVFDKFSGVPYEIISGEKTAKVGAGTITISAGSISRIINIVKGQMIYQTVN
ncbi:hypothetical protein CO101_00775 [Candidatus Berkelbacteria bacterium CG_4_9_14_3_um_filter_39_23]|uniref:General secretion pathway GspH domain-containing protein n=2 Tax=Candidatus Berkelbacteria TaxID=1618330 RepID=A0A2M8C697_9BACT|nr:MAG: hypothetical protein COV39_00205 [Candidatus Berkelbacteria bacterium CG11_big_fil_rev_8_21_14_0_20_40_23]PIX30594.1 MAG: hypothetical protein COZ62_01855 [Candidatus Berkelbacteria bacterium CG_4_8_14_3_um_filter_39_27]PIZ28606.1 MAG: hypothetical protein COY44_03335 [Candidatus Berkelbacteria bacterium CG_4_10_14_0_8_um_filter_39_42]PJB51773.1 MAG: hypothetical protein CO101_00775 [Candidatus Berkelbacteria bacterium CG_4_9_14_3_um_filter_39_23]